MSENGTNVPLLEIKSQEPNGTEILKVDPKESQSLTRKSTKFFKLDRNLSNGMYSFGILLNANTYIK